MVPKPIYIRHYNHDTDRIQFATWLDGNKELTNYQPSLIKQSSILVAFNEDGILAFLPTHIAVVLGALAPNPAVDSHTMIRAIAAFNQYIVCRAIENKVPEVYCQPNPESFAQMLREYSGYEDVKLPTVALSIHKIKDQSLKAPDAQKTPQS